MDQEPGSAAPRQPQPDGPAPGTSDAAVPDDPRWAGSEPRLVEAIRDEILATPERRITFARFMERALTEPGLGYYASSQLRPTRAGDFLTAPELHPFFGRCLGRFLSATWQRAGSPQRYVVREYGGGRGTLRDTALAGLAVDDAALTEAIAWQLVDLPPGSVEPAGMADVVIANEYLDALPVHRLVRHGDDPREIYVGWEEDWFCERLGAPSSPELVAALAVEGIELRPGQRAEVCPGAPRWVRGVAADLSPDGILLVIDYGHEASELYGPRRMAGTLLTYQAQAVSDDPFVAVGHRDITAHVDLSALDRAAREADLEPLGRTTQGRFLADLGLGQLLDALGRDPGTDPRAYLEARSAVVRLLDPRHLGAFAVAAWVRRSATSGGPGRMQDLPGFRATSGAR